MKIYVDTYQQKGFIDCHCNFPDQLNVTTVLPIVTILLPIVANCNYPDQSIVTNCNHFIIRRDLLCCGEELTTRPPLFQHQSSDASCQTRLEYPCTKIIKSLYFNILLSNIHPQNSLKSILQYITFAIIDF